MEKPDPHRLPIPEILDMHQIAKETMSERATVLGPWTLGVTPRAGTRLKTNGPNK